MAGGRAVDGEDVTACRGGGSSAAPEVDVISYFLSRREADADSARFLAAVVPQLAYLVEEDPPPAELHAFRALWRRAADRAAAAGRHLLLVVDGLDEDLRPPGSPSVAAVLPAGVGGLVHVLVSSRPYPELPVDLPAGHPLGSAHPVTVEPFAGAEELAALARQEIHDLKRRDESGLAADVLGLLTAAGGPLAVEDLAALTVVTARSATRTRKSGNCSPWRRPVACSRSARRGSRYQFAHDSLLEYARTGKDLTDPEFRRRIHQWAQTWRDARLASTADGEKGTPQYLWTPTQARWPGTRSGWRLWSVTPDGPMLRSSQWARTVSWPTCAGPPAQAHPAAGAMLATVVGQAHHLRPSPWLGQPGYVARQLCLQAAELGEDRLAGDLRARLRSQPALAWCPCGPRARAVAPYRSSSAATAAGWGRWRCCRTGGWSPAAAAVDGQVLVWDPARPGGGPVELGRHDDGVRAVAVLPDGRVVTGGWDRRVLVWDPARRARPGRARPPRWRWRAVAVLPDGRVVTGGTGGCWCGTSPRGPRSLSWAAR